MAEISTGSGFAPHSEADWLAAVETALRGKAFDSLTTKDVDGIIRQPLYTDAATKPPTQAPDCPALRRSPAVPKRFRTNICPGILPSVLWSAAGPATMNIF